MDRELAKTTSDINTFRSVLMEAECSIPESQLQQIDGLNKSLASVNDKLEQCVSKADQLDYLLAIASGILCGAIDSLYVGQLTVTAEDIKLSHKQVNEFIEKYAKKKGWNGEGRLESAVKFLEDKYPVAQDMKESGRCYLERHKSVKWVTFAGKQAAGCRGRAVLQIKEGKLDYETWHHSLHADRGLLSRDERF